MSRFLTLLSALTLASPALAADLGFGLETGTQQHHNSGLSPLFNADGTAIPGGSVHADLTERVRVQLGYQYSNVASDLHLSDGTSVSLFLSEHRALPGVRLDLGHERFGPYLEVNGVVASGALWADDDRERRTNPGQTKTRAMSFGVQPLAGLEFRLPMGPPNGSRALAFHIESGWSFETNPVYGDVGTLGHGGYTLRLGATFTL